jgi:hypothetical protein
MPTRGGRLLGVILAVAVVLSVVPGPAVAQDADDVNLDRLVEAYNANVDRAPGVVRGQLAGQSVELRVGEGSTVAGPDSGTVYRFTTAENGTVTSYAEGEAADPDYRVRTSEDAFLAIVDSSDPAAEFGEQRDAGNVRINGVGVSNAVKVEAVKAAVRIGQTLGLF